MSVDFHSHILPGIDDGSRSPEESVEMLKLEAGQKIEHVVMTPHFYAQYDDPDRFLRRRQNAKTELEAELVKHSGMPQLFVGAEVYYYSGMSESDILNELVIEGTNYILVEMPVSRWSDQMYEELDRIYRRRNLIPIVAHVDRYISRFNANRITERLERLPVLVQANAEFFLQKSTAGMAMRLLKQDRIHLLGSDCHNLSDRKPNMGMAIEVIWQKAGPDAVKRIEFYEKQVLQSL